ncbi:MAG: toll/interleukin-1 receptor domain-containing protein [Rhodomicrobium sp.]
MADVFISYARPDRSLAEALARDLTARGFSVWWDAELVAVDDYTDVIFEALRQSKVAIVIWTKTSAKSRFVRDEARFALHLEKLITVKAPSLDIYEIPFGFQGQHTDNVNDREQIFRAIHKLGARPTGAAAASNWDRIKATGTVNDISKFLASNPSNAQSREALARLKQLGADPNAIERHVSSAIGALRRSNWQAFFDGFTLQVPKFQLSEQGTWTSIGAAITYSIIAIGLGLTASQWPALLGETPDSSNSQPLLGVVAVAIVSIVLWIRTGGFLAQRNFIAAIILSLTLPFLAAFVTDFVIEDSIWWTPTSDDKLLYFVGILTIYLNISVWRIRAYR